MALCSTTSRYVACMLISLSCPPVRSLPLAPCCEATNGHTDPVQISNRLSVNLLLLLFLLLLLLLLFFLLLLFLLLSPFLLFSLLLLLSALVFLNYMSLFCLVFVRTDRGYPVRG